MAMSVEELQTNVRCRTEPKGRPMPQFDIIIKDGMIFDGARNPRFKSDLGIKDGVITAMGHLRASDANRVIDAEGLHVAPGFIDLHTHYDAQIYWDPYCS